VSSAPGAKVMQFHQALGEKLGGSRIEARNVEYIDRQLQGILKSSGMDDAQAAAATREILDPTAAVPAGQAGARVQARSAAMVRDMENQVRQYAATADTELEQQFRRLQAIQNRPGQPEGELGELVADGIRQARKDFSRAASKIYSRIDEVVGGEAVVPTRAMKQRAQELLDAMPRNAAGEPIFGNPQVLRSIQSITEMDDAIPFAMAQRARTALGDLAQDSTLTPGLPKREFDQLRRSVDVSFNNAAADPRVQPAVRMLREADRFYADGIRRFDDQAINRLVQQVRSGNPPDAAVIAEQVIKPGYSARANQIRQMVGPETWKRVASADFDNMVRGTIDPSTGEISVRKLARAIDERRDLLDMTYGQSVARDMREWSQRLAARDARIPADQLRPGNFRTALRDLEMATAQRDSFLRDNIVGELVKSGKSQDEAVAFIVKPGHEKQLAQAFDTLGPNSSEVGAIRQQALKELLNSAVTTSPTGAGRTVAGDALDKALSKYTRRQQEMLFPDGLADDLRLIAKEARFLFPRRETQMAAGLAAGGISMTMPASAPAWGAAVLINMVLSSPRTARVIAEGLRQPGPAAQATRQAITALTRQAGIAAVPGTAYSGEQSPEAPEQEPARPQAPVR